MRRYFIGLHPVPTEALHNLAKPLVAPKTLNLQMPPQLAFSLSLAFPIQNWRNVKVVLKHKTLLDNVFDCISGRLGGFSHVWRG